MGVYTKKKIGVRKCPRKRGTLSDPCHLFQLPFFRPLRENSKKRGKGGKVVSSVHGKEGRSFFLLSCCMVMLPSRVSVSK